MPLEDLPKPIKEHILNYVNREYEAAPNTYSLTDLLYGIRRSYYKKSNPKPITSIKSAFNLYRGLVFDQLWTPLFKRNQIRCTYRLKYIPITISGKYDFIDENGVLTDLKMPKTLFYTTDASEEYKKQIRFYGYCNAMEKCQILSVDGGDCKKFPVETGDCTALLEELETKATILFWALQRGKAPPKDCPPWMCPDCQWTENCAKDE